MVFELELVSVGLRGGGSTADPSKTREVEEAAGCGHDQALSGKTLSLKTGNGTRMEGRSPALFYNFW